LCCRLILFVRWLPRPAVHTGRYSTS
jgi:hypothetical protein